MKKKNNRLVLGLVALVLFLGVGYAVVSGVDLTISGTASTVTTDLDVFFTGDTETDTTGATRDGATENPATVTATATEEGLTATIAVTNLEKVGDTVTATYTIKNNEDSLSASILKSTITQTKNTYFKVTTSVDTNPLVLTHGATGNVTVTVELIKVPVESTDCTDNIEITLAATPVEA